MSTSNRSAPGGSGSPARWTSSAKSGVGTALSLLYAYFFGDCKFGAVEWRNADER